MAQQVPKVRVSAKVSGDKIVLTYIIPAGHHQTYDKSLFKFVVKPVKGIEFGEIVYPVSKKDKEFEKEFHGMVQISRTYKISGKPATKDLEITASYQVCKDSGVCFMPEDVKVKLTLP
jgi:thiol:disulfide interchange protein